MSASESAFRMAAVQMVSGTDVAANLAEAGRRVAEAAERGAQLVALPEYFALIDSDETAKVRIRERDGEGPIQDFLQETAARHQVWLVGGSLPLVASDANKVMNSTLVYDPSGQRIARYDKIHLFSFTKGNESYDESQSIVPGGEVVTFDTPFAKVGLSICYDLRFPELYRALGEVDVVVVPAAFTYTTGQAHWELLLRARAVENQCYVLASAQGGQHQSGRKTWGHSMVVDPWGTVLDVVVSGTGVASAQFDPELLTSVRANLPALKHRVL